MSASTDSRKPLSRRARAAVQKYGEAACLACYAMAERGYGASGIAYEGPVEVTTTRQADAAIDAGRELAGAAR